MKYQIKRQGSRIDTAHLVKSIISKPMGKAYFLALALAAFFGILNTINFLNSSANDEISSLNESILKRKMRADGFALIAIKDTASYEGECQGNENRIIDTGQYNETFFVFCRIWSPDDFPSPSSN